MNPEVLFRCLSDPTRLRILQEMSRTDECCVTDFVTLTGKEQTNVSHHLALLRECGVVVAQRDGKRMCYRIAHPGLRDLIRQAESLSEHIACCTTQGCC